MDTMTAIREVSAVKKTVEIDFLYLDLDACTRCRDTGANLDEALARVAAVLESAGAEVVLRKTLVDTLEKAEALRFVISPTIRVNGRDIALERRESRCESCESCVCQGTVDCRVWVYEGREHTEAPIPMIVEALLREVYSGSGGTTVPETFDGVPENLKRFYADRIPTASPGACCSTAEQTTCCEPAEKSSCCGAAEASTCGCRSRGRTLRP